MGSTPKPTSYMDEDEAYDERQRREALWAPQQASTSKSYRHIHIDWPNASIKKAITIGASAPDASPPVYDRPLSANENDYASSCVLITKSSPIHATVHILKEKKPVDSSPSSSKAKPILVSAKTGAVGSISLTIPDYSGARPLHIKAKSSGGNITIYLPSSFSGLLNWSSETGTLKVSHAMQQRFKLVSEPHKHKGTAKIVPSTASGLRGDMCTVTNRHGSITIKEFDEGEAGSDSKSCVVQ